MFHAEADLRRLVSSPPSKAYKETDTSLHQDLQKAGSHVPLQLCDFLANVIQLFHTSEFP